MSLKLPDKDPQSVVDYGWDWSAWLAGDTIIASSWTVPAGVTRTREGFTPTGTTVWLSGGTVGEHYALTNHIVTAGGREEDRTFEVWVVEK